jgi:hypothetical protein
MDVKTGRGAAWPAVICTGRNSPREEGLLCGGWARLQWTYAHGDIDTVQWSIRSEQLSEARADLKASAAHLVLSAFHMNPVDPHLHPPLVRCPHEHLHS